jgi:hypothetical protein
MTKVLIVGAMFCAILLATRDAQAQDAKRMGLVFGVSSTTGFGTPAGVALDWELSSWAAIQPEVYFLNETLVFGTDPPVRDQWSLSAGVRGVFYVGTWDAVRIYVSPRVAHLFATGVGPLNTGPTVSGTFGAQYRLGSRIGLFAEVGAEYTRLTNTSQNGSSINASFGDRHAFGAILFF